MSKRKFVDIRDIADVRTLREGFDNASAGYKGDRADVQKYQENLEENLRELRRRLLSGEWNPDSGRAFMLFTEGKWREITTVGVEDRIVHYALIKYFGISERFVKRTFGSIKGRGTLKASKQVRRDLRNSGFELALKLDAQKYYPHINKRKLVGLLEKRYKGRAALELLAKVIYSYKPGMDCGVSIGALTSQDLGNFYLTPFDYFVIYALGLKYYTRYVDDIVILLPDKAEARRVIPLLIEMAGTLDVVFGSIELFPVWARRIDFCGWAANRVNVRLRKSTLRRYIKKLELFSKRPDINTQYKRNCICSYLGMLKYCDSYKLQTILKREYYEVFREIDRLAKRRRNEKTNVAVASTGNGRVPTLLQPPGRGKGRAGRNRRGDRGTYQRNRKRASC